MPVTSPPTVLEKSYPSTHLRAARPLPFTDCGNR